MGQISEIEPRCIFERFEEITQIPRGSGNEKKISDYLVEFADRRGLIAYRDEHNNVTVLKPASAGMEDRQTVILQAHMDMVCVAEEDKHIDFDNTPVEAYSDGEYIRAKGTSLGADDGIGMAMILAVLDSDTVKHPMIEAVFTTDEEVGMGGAQNYDFSKLAGNKMINLDTEEENHIVVGCAGGCTCEISGKCKKEKAEGIVYEVTVSGLTGGHSGVQIGNELANANVLMGRLLGNCANVSEIALNSVDGGLRDNAICRQTKATVVVKKKTTKEFEKIVEKTADEFKKEYLYTEPNLNVKIKEKGKDKIEVISAGDFRKVTGLLQLLPNGTDRYVKPGDEVIASANVGILRVRPKSFCISTSLRGNQMSLRDSLTERVTLLAEAFDAKMFIKGSYPAWEKSENSDFARSVAKKYTDRFMKPIEIVNIHAGLECAFFSRNLKDTEIISIGPDIEGAHTTEECLSIASVVREWELLKAVLME